MPSTCYTGGDTGEYKKAPQPGRLLQRHHLEPERRARTCCPTRRSTRATCARSPTSSPTWPTTCTTASSRTAEIAAGDAWLARERARDARTPAPRSSSPGTRARRATSTSPRSRSAARPPPARPTRTAYTHPGLLAGLEDAWGFPRLNAARRPTRCRSTRRSTRASPTFSLDSGMQRGPVDQLLDVAVERPALDQLQVEVRRTLEDPARPRPTGDHGEQRHLHVIDQPGGHQRPVQ